MKKIAYGYPVGKDERYIRDLSQKDLAVHVAHVIAEEYPKAVTNEQVIALASDIVNLALNWKSLKVGR